MCLGGTDVTREWMQNGEMGASVRSTAGGFLPTAQAKSDSYRILWSGNCCKIPVSGNSCRTDPTAQSHRKLRMPMPMAAKKRDYSQYEKLLKALRQRLRGDVRSMSDVALHSDSESDLSHVPTHLADKGTESFLQEFALAMVESEEDTLAQIDAALERLESGQYGTCLNCEKPIPKARLNAIPYTAYCVNCASKLQS